jgi:hypothetical protein
MVAVNVHQVRFPAMCERVRRLLTAEPEETTNQQFEEAEEWCDRLREVFSTIKTGLDIKSYHDSLQR